MMRQIATVFALAVVFLWTPRLVEAAHVKKGLKLGKKKEIKKLRKRIYNERDPQKRAVLSKALYTQEGAAYERARPAVPGIGKLGSKKRVRAIEKALAGARRSGDRTIINTLERSLLAARTAYAEIQSSKVSLGSKANIRALRKKLQNSQLSAPERRNLEERLKMSLSVRTERRERADPRSRTAIVEGYANARDKELGTAARVDAFRERLGRVRRNRPVKTAIFKERLEVAEAAKDSADSVKEVRRRLGAKWSSKPISRRLVATDFYRGGYRGKEALVKNKVKNAVKEALSQLSPETILEGAGALMLVDEAGRILNVGADSVRKQKEAGFPTYLVELSKVNNRLRLAGVGNSKGSVHRTALKRTDFELYDYGLYKALDLDAWQRARTE
jgi:hypothetical protein